MVACCCGPGRQRLPLLGGKGNRQEAKGSGLHAPLEAAARGQAQGAQMRPGRVAVVTSVTTAPMGSASSENPSEFTDTRGHPDAQGAEKHRSPGRRPLHPAPVCVSLHVAEQ